MKYKIDGNNISSDKRGNLTSEDFQDEVRNPSYTDLLKISIDEEEKFKSRARSIVSYGGNIQTKTTTTRSLWKAITNFDNFPITEIESVNGRSVVTLSSPFPSEILDLEHERGKMKVQSLSFLGTPKFFSIDLEKKSLFASDSLASIEVEKTNDKGLNKFFVAGFGGVSKIQLEDDELTNIKEDYLLAIDETVSYEHKEEPTNIRDKAFNVNPKPTVRVKGPGRVYLHSNSPFEMNRMYSKLKRY